MATNRYVSAAPSVEVCQVGFNGSRGFETVNLVGGCSPAVKEAASHHKVTAQEMQMDSSLAHTIVYSPGNVAHARDLNKLLKPSAP